MRIANCISVLLLLASGCISDSAPEKDSIKQRPLVLLNDANFNDEVLNSPQPVLVDFWAPWCQPCLEMKPILRELAHEYAGRIKIAELNIDENPMTPEKYGVKGIPAVLLFRNGEFNKRRERGQTREQLVRLIEPLINRDQRAVARKL